MPSFAIHERLIPYRLLAYMLYAQGFSWLYPIGKNQVRIVTGDAARELRIKNSALWEAINWLNSAGLVRRVRKEEKRGSVIVTLAVPNNVDVWPSQDLSDDGVCNGNQ